MCDPAADKNGDGIIDLIETEPMSGTTMVPFHDNPVSMQIVNFPATKLPATVASLDDVPAQVTLPIACGKIEKVSQ